MTDSAQMFAAVDDCYLSRAIRTATERVVFIAPGIGKETAASLVALISKPSTTPTVRIVMDADPDAWRIGYGDLEGLEAVRTAARSAGFQIRRHDGIRIGILMVDDRVVVWSPTPQSVEPQRTEQQPNAILLGGEIARSLESVVAPRGDDLLPMPAEIGNTTLSIENLEAAIHDLKENPPEPFDLARRSRVFSTRFQFVESEVRGAEWIGRRIKLSTLLVNADLPKDLQQIFETQVKPFQSMTDEAVDVQLVVDGERMFKADGTPMLVKAKQSDIMKSWETIRDTYLRQLKGFGWLIRRDRLDDFQRHTDAFEGTMREWVEAFRTRVEEEEDTLLDSIVKAIKGRIERAAPQEQMSDTHLKIIVQKGLDKLRVIEPQVRVVLKNISWESSRDSEFLAALTDALPPEELKGWYEEFTAARQRTTGATD